MLEVAWEVFERAGVAPASVRGSSTGVFVGSMAYDYGPRLHEPVEEAAGFLLTGSAASMASGRLAYVFGLRGPALTVDTACSSSLVALHLAARSVSSGECEMALAGGATVMSTPGAFIEFARQRGLAADGRCRSFAAQASGTVWAEGVGLLLVERLSRARTHGHPVLAVLRGSAINQDGASNGLTAPSGTAQRSLLHEALRSAGLTAADVDAVEGHGTGTPLGDPVELSALADVYGSAPRTRPLLLGSLKSNLGHAQAAAGVAGVMKMILALQHERVPATLHAQEPSPTVDWDAGTLTLVTQPIPWPASPQHVRRAGISSFGISGTNAHVIIEEPPAPPAATPGPAVMPLLLSARTATGLRDQARRLHQHLTTSDTDLDDIAHTLATGRDHFTHRATILRDGNEHATLAALARDLAAEGLRTGTARAGRRLAMFAGQGTQRAGMGRRLYDTFAAYADAFDEVCAALDEHLDRPLKSIVQAAPATAEAVLLDRTGYAQPALFATEVALYRLLRSWGFAADVVMGHSIGELAAAHVAGVFPVDDAAALVAARGRLMQALPGGGRMVSVRATRADVEPLVSRYADRAGLAAVNGPRSVVVSGAADAVEAIVGELESWGHRAVPLTVSHAFHSPLMEPMLDDFRAVAGGVRYRRPEIPVLSNVTGRAADPAELCTPRYWVDHIRRPVLFADGVAAACAAGVTHLVEVGPTATLSGLAREVLDEQPGDPRQVVPLLRGGRDEVAALLEGLAVGYAGGLDLDWAAVARTVPGRVTDLPTYPFEEKHYWLAPATAEQAFREPDAASVVEIPATGDRMWSGRLSPRRQPWLGEHVVAGEALVPGAAVVELVLAAGRAAGHGRVDELVLEAPLPVDPDSEIDVQVLIRAGDAAVTVHGRPAGGAWARVASGRMASDEPVEPQPWTAWPPAGATAVTLDGAYPRLAADGLRYGPSYQGLRALWRHGDEAYAEVVLPAGVDGFDLHPVLLDCALHAVPLLGLAAAEGAGAATRVPFLWRGVTRYRPAGSVLRVRLAATGTDTVSVDGYDEQGRPVVSVAALTLRPVTGDGDLFTTRWVPAPQPVADGVAELAIAADAGLALPAGEALALAAGDEELRRALPGARPAGAGRARVVVLAAPRPADDGPAAVRGVVTQVAPLLRSLLDEHDRVVVVTRTAVTVTAADPDVDLAGRAVWGLVRSVQAEEPGRVCLLDHDGDPASLAALASAVSSGLPQLALRSGAAHVPELAPAPPGLVPPPAVTHWRLDHAGRGAPENIRLVAAPETAAALSPGEIRVAPYAIGVNFRDVLLTLGVVAAGTGVSEAAAGAAGVEGAGVVLETAPDVTDLAIGDRVTGLFREAGPVTRTDSRLVVRIPQDWSFARAAALPVAFLTAWHGLVDLAGVRAGDRVLVHTATGAVGMAAVRIARHLGAEVFATASPGKQDVLRGMGLPADHIASSRDAGFEDAFRAVAPDGLDVVLNSLAGELTDASLRLLRPGGCFLEMGKTDMRDGQVPGVRYRRFDIREVAPASVRWMLGRMVALAEEGVLAPPPITRWPFTQAPAAYRHVAEARHVGKVVLDLRVWDPSRAVLITGGLGTLGVLVAEHLVSAHGVRQLILVSRRGAAAPDADRVIDRLTALGAKVTVAACDVGDRAALSGLLRRTADDGVRIGAVVHAAGITRDATLGGLTAERVESVLRPKADAARHLDELTRDADLTAFVLFSSIAATVGSAGQGNYAAANAVLDGIVERRRRRGLPAVSIAWGLWEPESAITGRLTATDRARLSRQGILALDGRRGLELFDAAVAGGDAVPVAARLGTPAPVPAAATSIPIPAGPAPAAAGLGSVAAGSGSAAAGTGDVQQTPDSPRESAASEPILDLIRREVAAVLGHASLADVPGDALFKELGLDSLGAIELRNRISVATGVALPATLIFDFPTAEDLAEHLLRVMAAPGADQREEPHVHG
ncbi:type I polyketide synthase [Actinoplanes missouriensis]|uniref:type I polyketide synthase n=1 Tax=Actinoplanes missouriensis TaxID=1866 RepID=UPI0033F70E22